MEPMGWHWLWSELPIRYPLDKGSFRCHWSKKITRETDIQSSIPKIYCRTIAMTVINRNGKGLTLCNYPSLFVHPKYHKTINWMSCPVPMFSSPRSIINRERNMPFGIYTKKSWRKRWTNLIQTLDSTTPPVSQPPPYTMLSDWQVGR